MTRGGGVFAVYSLLIYGLGGGLLGCSSNTSLPSVAPETVTGVAVISAQTSTVPDLLEAVGTVRAVQSAQIASQTMGNIVEIRVQEGDRVRTGQILAIMDDTQPKAGVEQSAAAVTAAQKEVSSADRNWLWPNPL